MAFIYTAAALLEILILFVSFAALVIFVVRAVVRSIVSPREPPPKPEDLRHLKRAGQSGFY